MYTGRGKSDRRGLLSSSLGGHKKTLTRVNIHAGLSIAPHLCGWDDVWGLNVCEGLDIAEPS